MIPIPILIIPILPPIITPSLQYQDRSSNNPPYLSLSSVPYIKLPQFHSHLLRNSLKFFSYHLILPHITPLPSKTTSSNQPFTVIILITMRSTLILPFALLPLALAKDIAVQVGNKGNNFDPTSVTGSKGDTVTFSFIGGDHSVAQSSFDKPCHPIANAIYSGFIPGGSPPVSWSLQSEFLVATAGSVRSTSDSQGLAS